MAQETLYRFRSFNNPANTSPSQAGWSDWEFVTKKKYNEILGYIYRGTGNYQAQMLTAEIEDHKFDLAARGYVEPLYQMTTETDFIDAPVVKAVEKYDIPRLRAEHLHAGKWASFEVSFDNGESWQNY
jgi:hypothetical protein